MKNAIMAFAALIVLVLSTQLAYGTSPNGVYIHVNISADVHDVPNGLQNEISYSCHGSSGGGRIDSSSSLVYCRDGADLTVKWLEITGKVELSVEDHTIVQSRGPRCGFGEANVWLMARCDWKNLKMCTTMIPETYCQRCDYSGGPCE